MNNIIYILSVKWVPLSNLTKTNESVIGVFDSQIDAKAYMSKYYKEYELNSATFEYIILSFTLKEGVFNKGFGINLDKSIDDYVPILFVNEGACILKSDKEVIPV